MFNKKSLTGLDIGTSSIKVVTLKENPKGLEVTNIGISPLPLDAIENGIVLDPDAVANSIEKAFDHGKIKEKRVYTALSGDSIITREVEMPKMTHEELKEAIRWEAEEYLPFNLEDAVIDFVVLNELEENLNVLLVAARQEVVDSFLLPLEKAKIKPITLNIEPFALHSILGYNTNLEEKNQAIIDIGYASTAIILMKGHKLELIRSLGIGGRDFTQLLQEAFELTLEQAENLKIQVSNDPDSTGMIFDEIPIDNIRDVLLQQTLTLLEEINRSFNYFQVQQRGENLQQIYLTGNGSLLGGLADTLFRELAVPVELLDPFANIQFNREFDTEIIRNISSLSVAIGLVLSELEES